VAKDEKTAAVISIHDLFCGHGLQLQQIQATRTADGKVSS
jgi:hypothetical protein